MSYGCHSEQQQNPQLDATNSALRKKSPLAKLSKRERQCTCMHARGMSANAVSQKLGLSKRTVEDYLERAKNKLACANKFELIDFVISNDIFKYEHDSKIGLLYES